MGLFPVRGAYLPRGQLMGPLSGEQAPCHLVRPRELVDSDREIELPLYLVAAAPARLRDGASRFRDEPDRQAPS